MSIENFNGKILVAGATGGVGQELVRQLLKTGARVRLLVRAEKRARKLFSDGIEIMPGDTRLPDSLPAALAGIRYVICATGTRSPFGKNSPQHVDYEGVRNLAQAARAAGVEHFVLVSSISVTRPENPLNKFGRVLDWKLAGENALRASGLNYSVVRPGGLSDRPSGQVSLQFDQGDRISGMVGRADVAQACLQALLHPETRNATFEMIENPAAPTPPDWAALFAGLKPDPANLSAPQQA